MLELEDDGLIKDIYFLILPCVTAPLFFSSSSLLQVLHLFTARLG